MMVLDKLNIELKMQTLREINFLGMRKNSILY